MRGQEIGKLNMHMMGPFQLLLVAIVVLVLFGRGKVSNLMGEVGKGISAFKKGVGEGAAEVKAAADAEMNAVAKDVTPADSETKDKV